MALQATPLLREDSILCWDIETTFKTAPAAATWQALGRVEEWTTLGPRKQVYRNAIAGSGREAATIGVAGTAYPPTTLGPFQIVDPRIMGFAWGQEPNPPVALGSGYYRHTTIPTTLGRHPSMSVQMGDYKTGTLTDGQTWLGVVMPRLSVRGEEASEEPESGRVMMAPTLLPHDDSITVPSKAVTLPTQTPYYKQHANIQFYNGDVDWRINSWEFNLNSNSETAWYHRAADQGKPNETPPQGILYDARFEIVADGHQNAVSNKLIRDLLRDEVKGNIQIKYARTLNQDEWAINITDFHLEDAPKRYRRGKNVYEPMGYGRSTTFEWVDQNSTRYFPQ